MLPPIQCPRSTGHGCRAPQAQGRSKCGVLRLTLSQLLPLHPTKSALISGVSHTDERARSRRLTEVTTLEAFLGEGLCKIKPTTPVILTSETRSPTTYNDMHYQTGYGLESVNPQTMYNP